MTEGIPASGNTVAVIFGTADFSNADGPGLRSVVFFQGCPFGCPWCHSPHSRPDISPLLFRACDCTLCRRCAESCPNGAHKFADSTHEIDRALCRKCGRCIAACPRSSAGKDAGVLHLPTRTVSVEELYRQLPLSVADGITLSGGEALLQIDAAIALLRLCRNNGVHTAVETSGLLKESDYALAAPYVDTWLFGLRVLTDCNDAYKTDQLATALRAIYKHSNAAILPRVPVIPGVMDRPEVLQEISSVLALTGSDKVWLNPWNRFYAHYYDLAGLNPTFSIPTEEAAQLSEAEMTAFFTGMGYTVHTIENTPRKR